MDTKTALIAGAGVLAAATAAGLYYAHRQYKDEMQQRRQEFEDLKSGKKKDPKKAAGNKLVKALTKKKAAPKAEPLDNMFEMPEEDLLKILDESYNAMSDPESAAIPRYTPEAKKSALRDQKIGKQISSVTSKQIAKLSPKLRLEFGRWFSTYSNMRYATFVMAGVKSADVKRDNEIIWKLLTFTADEFETFSNSDKRTIKLIAMDAANQLEDKNKLAECFDYLTTQPIDEAVRAEIEALGFTSGLSVDELIMLFPMAAFLGKWSWVRKLGADLSKIDGALENFHATSKQMAHIPDMLALYRFATTYSPPDERDIVLDEVTVGTVVKTPYGEGKIVEEPRIDGIYKIELINWHLAEDTPVHVFSVRDQFDVPKAAAPVSTMGNRNDGHPHPFTANDRDLEQIQWQEYHVRSAHVVIDFDKSASADPAYLNNLKEKMGKTDVPPRTFGPGERRFLVRGAVAQIRSHSPKDSQIYGPYNGGNEFVFASEDTLPGLQGAVVQNEEYFLTKGEEDIMGVSTMKGVFRLKQINVGAERPLLNFLFNMTLTVQRVLTPEERAKAELTLAKNAKKEAEKLAAAADAAAAKANAAAGEIAVGTSVKTPFGIGLVVDAPREDGTYKIELTNWRLSEGAPVFVFSQADEVNVATPAVSEEVTTDSEVSVGTEVSTPYGKGVVVEVREDGMCKVELTHWRLAESTPVFVFSKVSEVNVIAPAPVVDEVEAQSDAAAATESIIAGSAVVTPYGNGVVVDVREDGIAKVELVNWRLAEDTPVFVFSMKSELVKAA